MHTSNTTFKSGFTNKINTHHPIRYSTTCTKKSQPKPHQLPPEIHKQNLVEKLFFEKMGELTPSKKTNTYLENIFYYFKNPTWLVFQKHDFSK